MNSRVPLPSSFRDPSGFLFREDGVLYRQVNRSYAKAYDHLMESGLYDDLIHRGLLIPHKDVSDNFKLIPPAYKIIKPEPITFISYPYEWCFSQLKDAALTTLRIQKVAFEYGMSLKDSSAYNIQFYGGKPILIDSLSFEIYRENEPWVAYRQFCQHFLAPLVLMAYKDVRLLTLLRVYIDGIPLDLASSLLPIHTRMALPILTHIHLHAKAQKRFAHRGVKSNDQSVGGVSRLGFQGLIDSLERCVHKLQWKSPVTDWEAYYSFHEYSDESLEDKKRILEEYLQEIQPTSVWDLGANTGLFSRLASDKGFTTLSFDIDPGAVERNYREVVEKRETNILPLVLDLTNPSPGLGWSCEERASLLERGSGETVFALALIHHLAISNNVPLSNLAKFFKRMGKWLVIEFIPKQDPQVQKLLASREDIFDDYNVEKFLETFGEFFSLQRSDQVKGSLRTMYLMQNKED